MPTKSKKKAKTVAQAKAVTAPKRRDRSVIPDAGVRAAIKAAGNGFRLAHAIGITPAAIYRWSKVPTDKIKIVERATGVRRERLRPDLY